MASLSNARAGAVLLGLSLLGTGLAGCQRDQVTLDNPVSVYETYCFACHNQGAAGAPRLDDVNRWQVLLEQGTEAQLVESTINGVRAMPPRGSCSACTDAQLAKTVRWMLEQNGL